MKATAGLTSNTRQAYLALLQGQELRQRTLHIAQAGAAAGFSIQIRRAVINLE